MGLVLVCACAPHRSTRPTPPAQRAPVTLIVNATVIDGTGEPARAADVRIEGDRIAAVGDLAPAERDRVVDGVGLLLVPGFVDTHSHADDAIFQHPDALAATSQGITTVVVGQDGRSPFPLADFFARLEREPPAVNIAAYIGHNTLRQGILGEGFRRSATRDEVARMRELVRAEMRAGALGLSTGLEYDPGIYSETAEVIALAEEAASAGGRYISHIRSEDRAFWQAVDEIIAVGRAARLPVQISHAKLAMRGLWGQADSLLARLERARASGVNITADVYPYTYWQSTLTVLFPERDFENRETAAFVLREVAAPEGLLLAQYDPEPRYVGKTVAEIAAMRGVDPVTTLIDLIRDAEAMRRATGRGSESVIGTSMAEEDVARLIAWRFANVCTDGELAGRHPRGFGAFPRVLATYVREGRRLRWEAAVRKMTALAAANVGIVERGTIAPGMYADVVLLDSATVRDRARPEDPHALSDGIRAVWVNGVLVYEHGRVTGRRPGRVVRRRAGR